jgi:hypothetical protein
MHLHSACHCLDKRSCRFFPNKQAEKADSYHHAQLSRPHFRVVLMTIANLPVNLRAFAGQNLCAKRLCLLAGSGEPSFPRSRKQLDYF